MLQSTTSYPTFEGQGANAYPKVNGNKRRPNEPLPRDDTKYTKKSGSGESGDFDFDDPMQTEAEGQGGFGGIFNIFKKILPAGQKNDKPNAKKIISVSPQLLSNIADIEQRCVDLGIRYKVSERAILVSGEPDKVQQIESYIMRKEEEIYKASPNRTESSSVRKDILLSGFLKNMMEHISKKADQLNVCYTFNGQNLTILGPQDAVTELVVYLVEIEATPGREKFDKKDFEEFTMRESEVNKSINDVLIDIKNKVDIIELRSNNGSAMDAPNELRLLAAMNDGLGDIKNRIEALEIRKDSGKDDVFQEEVKRTQSLNSYLVEIKKKIESLESKIGNNRSGEISQNQSEPEMIQALNGNLSDIKKKFGDLEVKMELDTDGIMDEEIKVQKAIADGFTKLNHKVDAIDMKIELSSGDLKMKSLIDNLEHLTKKIDAVEQKIESQSRRSGGGGGTDTSNIDRKFTALMNFIDEKLGGQGSALNASLGPLSPRSPRSPRPLDPSPVKPESEIKASQTQLVAAESENPDDYSQKEVSISVFHRSCQKEIEKKAEELKVFTEFGYDVILTAGAPRQIEKFIIYLQECELRQKKSLYPRHWDFMEIRKFALINLNPNTEEYREVSRLFNTGNSQYRPIIKIERIQNKYLMDHYITNIQKRKEFRSTSHLQRMLLFYGTGLRNPDIIYKNSDVGFDIQFAETRSGARGLSFSPTWSPGLFGGNTQSAHRTPSGTFQVLLADVLIGNSLPINIGNTTIVKAPEGYDSVIYSGGNYMIFNNFHSYPLYLIEFS